MTTLIESKSKPFGSSRGAIISFTIHAVLILGAIFATTEVVLPPREKVEEHPVLYVATPPPKPLEQPPAPLPKAPTPPKSKAPAKVFRAPPPQRRAPTPAPTPAPVAQPRALVAPTKIAVSLPPVDLKAPPTVSDVVVPSASELLKSSGVGTGGSVKRDAGDEGGGGSGRGLNSGSAGRAYDENQVDRAVEVTRKVDPRYPDALRSVNVEGVVVMRFIVGTDGRVEPGSIQAISSPNKLFTDAVRSALLGSRYRPAEAGGEKVRQLVEQQFAFRLNN